MFIVRGEDDIVELLWNSGHVVESSQAQRPPVPPPILRGSGSGGGNGEESAPLPLPLPQPTPLHSHHQQPSDQNLLIHEDEMASWLLHHPLREEDELHSHLFYSVSLTPPLPLQPQPPAAASASYTPTVERPMGEVIAGRRAESFFNFSRLRGNRVEAAAAGAQWVKDSTQTSPAPESCLTPMTFTGGVAQTFAVPSLSRKVVETETEPAQIKPSTETTEAADERKRKEREEAAEDTEVSQSMEARMLVTCHMQFRSLMVLWFLGVTGNW